MGRRAVATRVEGGGLARRADVGGAAGGAWLEGAMEAASLVIPPEAGADHARRPDGRVQRPGEPAA